MQGISFGGILGDFVCACPSLDIHVSAECQWEVGSMPSGSELGHCWLGDILCFRIPLLLCVRAWRGCFPRSPILNLFHHAQLVFISPIFSYSFL